MNREGLMLSRSERYLAKAEECQQISDAADASGTKRLFGVMASQWRQLAEEADETDKKPLPEKFRQAHSLREIDKAEDAIRKIAKTTVQEHPVPLRQPTLPTPGDLTAAGWRTEKGRDFVNPAQSLRIRLTSEVRKRNATPREAKIVPT